MEVGVKLRKIKDDVDGALLIVQAPGRTLTDYILQHSVNEGILYLSDGRSLSIEQRKKAYAMESDIAEYCGYYGRMERQSLHEQLKSDFCMATGEPWFSLIDCSVTTAKDYITFLIDFALRNGVPLAQSIMERTDDIDAALIICIRQRKCCICGCQGEIHHFDAIGMGFDRRKKDDLGSRVICLCRRHHMEAHTIGRESFCEKYKVYGIEMYRVKGLEACT